MNEVVINGIHTKTVQLYVELFVHIFSRTTHPVGKLICDFYLFPVSVLKGFAEDDFTFPVMIGPGCVKIINLLCLWPF